ncbi:MAG: tape measure protein [Pseudomonadota bacterium]|nr:tape measure protein [Pseudomonadota bacterium]
MSESVGKLYYIVDARTQALLDAERQVNRSTRRMGRSFDRADGAIGRVNSSLGELKTLVVAVGGALAVQKVVQYADAWTNLQNQLRQVTATESERTRVTEKLMAIANETRSGISSTANLYARLTRASETLGLSEAHRLRITETINKAFITSGATAQEAASAITQLSQGLASGTLRGEEFNAVAESAPPIMRAIAKELNMTLGELRAFAAEGGITAEVVVRAMDGMAKSMDTKFAKAAKSFGSQMTTANNNLTEFIGNSKAVTSAVTAAGDTIVVLSKHIDDIAVVAGLAATVMGGRLLGSLTASTAAYVKQNAAAIANAKVEAAAAAAVVRRTAAEKQAAFALLSTAKLEARATAGTSAHTFALAQLSVARKRAAAAAGQHAAATNAAAAASARAAIVMRGLSGALALLGGPVGVAVLAVSALIMYSDELDAMLAPTQRAKQAVSDLTDEIDRNSRAAVENGIARFTTELAEMEAKAKDARAEIERINDANNAAGPFRNSMVMGAGAEERKAQFEKLDALGVQIQARKDGIVELQQRLEALGDASGKGAGGGGGSTHPGESEPSKAAKEEAKRLDELRASYRRLRDELRPLEASQREYAESKATLVEYALRENMATSELQSLLADLKASYQSAQTAAEAYGNGAADASDKATQAAQDLDFAFQSAFESAIIEGENLRGVISGLAEDIARLTLRKSVTSPIAGYLSTAIGGAFRGGAVAGGWTSQIATAGYASGGYTGDGGKYEPAGIVHGGEYVVPKNVVDQPGMLGFLEQLSNTRGYLSGGYVGSSSRSGSYAGAGGETNITYAPVFQVQAQPGASEQDGQRLVKGMDTLIKSTFYKMVEKESRPGGVLNKR